MSFLAAIAVIILPSLLFPSPVSSALVNRTIDDEYGDSVSGIKPVYGPDDTYWHQGATCSECHITAFIDKTQPFDGTWHDGTYSPGSPDLTITLSFTGSAVYVFNVVPNTLDFTDTLSNITFTLDNTHVDTYVHHPDVTSTFLYRQLVYKNTNLANTAHMVEMRATGTNSSLILFDYAIYTAEQVDTSSSTSPSSTSSASSSAVPAPSSSSHSTPVAAIAGGIVGGIAFLAILAVVGFFFQRRRNPKEPRPMSAHLEIKPFVEGNNALAYGGGAVYHGSEYGSSGSGGNSGYGGGLGYGAGSGYGTTPRHTPRPSDTPTMPLLMMNPDPSVMPLPRTPDAKGGPMPLADGTRSPQGTPGSALRRQNTTAAQQQAELTQRIRALEDQMRGVTSPTGADSTLADPSHRASRPASSSGNAAMRALQSELAALRSEVAGLNAQLAEERMMGESLPPYWEDPSRPQ